MDRTQRKEANESNQVPQDFPRTIKKTKWHVLPSATPMSSPTPDRIWPSIDAFSITHERNRENSTKHHRTYRNHHHPSGSLLLSKPNRSCTALSTSYRDWGRFRKSLRFFFPLGFVNRACRTRSRICCIGNNLFEVLSYVRGVTVLHPAPWAGIRVR